MAEEVVMLPVLKANILEMLCPELIVEIFSYLEIKDLCRVALVCKHFKELAYSKRLWENVTFSCSLEQCANEDVMQSLMQKGIQLLCIAPREKDNKLQMFHQLLPKLKYLCLNLKHLSRNPIRRVHEVTKHVDCCTLRHLELHLKCPRENEDDTKLDEFLAQFPNVDSLVWSMIGYVDFEIWDAERINKEMKTVFEKLKKLEKLDVYFPIKTVQFPDVHYHHCDSLEQLTIQRLYFNGSTLRDIGQCFPNLQRLSFVYSKYIIGNIVQDCHKYLGHLQELKFINCENIPVEDINNSRGILKNIDLECY